MEEALSGTAFTQNMDDRFKAGPPPFSHVNTVASIVASSTLTFALLSGIDAWVNQHIPREQILFTATTSRCVTDAILKGLGAGFMPVWLASRYDTLVELTPRAMDWVVPIWLVTHVDLHRAPKVRAFIDAIKLGRDRQWASEDWAARPSAIKPYHRIEDRPEAPVLLPVAAAAPLTG